MSALDQKAVAEILKSALAAVRDSGITGDLTEPAFNAAVALLTTGAAQSAALPLGPKGGGGSPLQVDPPVAARETGSADVLEDLAATLEVDVSDVRKVYTTRDHVPELNVKSSKVPQAKSIGTQHIALLVMLARQTVEIEEYTDGETIRAVAKRYGKLDSGNFGKTMRGLDNQVQIRGKGATASRRLTHPGIEAATELLRKYAAEA
jgi:hypothetical protein